MSRKRQTKDRNEPRENSGFKPKSVVGRTPNQTAFIKTILANDITLAHGPAGTGKTHIAIGMAVYALRNRQIERIILCRPAVDSGASIGYLPGTMEEKIGPYLAPLFDELSYYVEPKFVKAWMEHKIIEIVPLPFMRGRTFNNAYVVLDEAQNATMPEIRMFLTRIGLNSRMILVGDLHQTDLPRDQRGAFGDTIGALDGMHGVGVSELRREDIIRHPLIGEIEKRLTAH
jgi:phosphate starvation-inducible PhoH-like protein